MRNLFVFFGLFFTLSCVFAQNVQTSLVSMKSSAPAKGSKALSVKTVKVGGQVWMAENVDTKVPGSWAYDQDEKNASAYGRLYSYQAALRVCPQGWHLPTDAEWQALINHFGGEDNAGQALKARGASGFNAMLAGLSSVRGFQLMDLYGTFWSATSYDNDHAWYYYVTAKDKSVTRTYFRKDYGFSVRCVQD